MARKTSPEGPRKEPRGTAVVEKEEEIKFVIHLNLECSQMSVFRVQQAIAKM